MAEAAATHAADALPSPSSVSGKELPPWDFSVTGGQDQNAISPTAKTRSSNDSSATHHKPNQRHHNHPYPVVNGTSPSRNSSRSGSRQGNPNDQNYLQPNRLDALGRREHSLSRTGSEADSLLDLYGRESANRSAVSVMDTVEKKGDKAPGYSDFEDAEHAHWIHRDKLAKIESEELQQFGIQFQNRRQTRAESKSSNGRGRSHDSYGNGGTNGSAEHSDQWTAASRDEKRRKITSPARVENIEHEDSDGEPMIFDPRLPEEIAADPYEDGGQPRMYYMPTLRKSSSRIPVLAGSYHPISMEHLGRDMPRPRTRNNTVGSGDGEIAHMKIRSPSDPLPASTDIAEPLHATPTTPQTSRPSSRSNPLQNSPSKAKTPSKQTPTPRKSSAPPTNRKTSGTGKPKTGTNSNKNNDNNNQRPVTRSGETRPSTAVNRPEGDPPWLATMYKPDPRLPPDQQILPTHARKMQQELWEKEGKLTSTYGRDFTPLAVRDHEEKLDALNNNNDENEKLTDTPAPTLRPPPPSKSPVPSLRPSTSGTDHGGYKTMPNVQTAPSPNLSQGSKTRPRPMDFDDSPPPKEKGCGCCIVM